MLIRVEGTFLNINNLSHAGFYPKGMRILNPDWNSRSEGDVPQFVNTDEHKLCLQMNDGNPNPLVITGEFAVRLARLLCDYSSDNVLGGDLAGQLKQLLKEELDTNQQQQPTNGEQHA